MGSGGREFKSRRSGPLDGHVLARPPAIEASVYMTVLLLGAKLSPGAKRDGLLVLRDMAAAAVLADLL